MFSSVSHLRLSLPAADDGVASGTRPFTRGYDRHWGDSEPTAEQQRQGFAGVESPVGRAGGRPERQTRYCVPRRRLDHMVPGEALRHSAFSEGELLRFHVCECNDNACLVHGKARIRR